MSVREVEEVIEDMLDSAYMPLRNIEETAKMQKIIRLAIALFNAVYAKLVKLETAVEDILDSLYMPLRSDVRGTGEMQKIIGLAIALIIASAIMPVALSNLASVNTSDWDPTAKTLWPLVSIFGVLAIVLIFLRYVQRK